MLFSGKFNENRIFPIHTEICFFHVFPPKRSLFDGLVSRIILRWLSSGTFAASLNLLRSNECSQSLYAYCGFRDVIVVLFARL